MSHDALAEITIKVRARGVSFKQTARFSKVRHVVGTPNKIDWTTFSMRAYTV